MRTQQGFSLIELMIVLVIVAILAAVAIPSYHRYVLRSHRVDAQRALIDLAARQERYLYSNNAYATELSELGAASSLAGGNYEVSIDPGASSSAYTVVADAIGPQQDDKLCEQLTLDQAGRQGSSGSTTNDPSCWGR